MHKLLVLYPLPAAPEAFRTYYLTQHLPLVAQLPGLRASWHSFQVQGVGLASPYFCIWQGEFTSLETLQAAMASPQGQAVAADVPHFASGGAVVLHMPAEPPLATEARHG